MPPQVTLQDIALKAGVHRSTVSLALKDHPRISKGVRDRVKAIATDMGYRVNPLVSALMQNRRTGHPPHPVTLGFVTNYPSRYGWRPKLHSRPDYFPGAVDRAKELGYHLEHFWLNEPGMTSRRFSDILSTRNINGIILGRLPPGQHSLDLAWDRFSCVALGMTLRQPRLHHVTENHFETAWFSMRRCIAYGYKRIGFVFSETNDSPRVGDRWLSAYMGHQLQLPESDRILPCPCDPPTFDDFSRWFKRERPDAILASHAKPILNWLQQMQVKVPEITAVIDLQTEPDLGCAGVYYEPSRIGALAVEMLVGLMHRHETGIPAATHEILLSGVWRDGWSLPDRQGTR
jgi:LacI family transcriptional regulator